MKRISLLPLLIFLVAFSCNNKPTNHNSNLDAIQVHGGGGSKTGGNAVSGVSPANPLVFNTTYLAETKPNVSACYDHTTQTFCAWNYPNDGTIYNGDPTGWKDNYALSTNPPSAPIITNPYNKIVRISKGRGTQYDIHKLTTYTGKILVHTQFWFGLASTSTVTRDGVNFPYSGQMGHMEVGYDTFASGRTKTDDVVQDLWDRGFDGISADWSGGQNNCKYPNFNSACSTGPKNRDVNNLNAVASIQALHPTMSYVLVYDDAAFKFQPNCAITTAMPAANQPACIQNKIDADLKYASTAYFTQPQYIKDSTGKPLVLFFVCAGCSGQSLTQCTVTAPCTTAGGTTCTSNTACWNSVWDGVNTYMSSVIHVPVTMVFENNGGFTHRASGGAFLWDPYSTASDGSITTATQLDWFPNGHSFYTSCNSSAYLSKICVGYARAKAEEHNAAWHFPLGRVLSTQCGNSWMLSLANNNGANGAGVDFIQVPTWDDYEEGSEIETGIDNCYNAPTLSYSSPTLTVTINPTAVTYRPANNGAVQDFNLFVSSDGTNYANLATLPVPTGNSFTIDLSQYGQLLAGQTYYVFVRQNGKPMLAQQASAALTIVR